MEADEREHAIEALRDRLSRLSEASLHISQSLDLDTVLREVVDGARSLTGARWSGMTTLDDSGQLQDFITSGFTPEERQQFVDMPEGPRLFEHLSKIPQPLRLRDLVGYLRSLGFSGNLPLLGETFLGTPMRHQGVHVGNFYLADKESGREFTGEDEEVVVMFASQAAMAIANARAYRDERRARTDLEALIDTSPVGVVVFAARTGEVVSLNREAGRIVGDLLMPGGSVAQLLDVLTFRRADGREISLDEFPLGQVLSTGETVRAEEIVIQVPDGRSVTTLVNATPIYSEGGEVQSVVVTLQDMTPLEELERLRAEFLGMVSHELRAPLTSIKGSVATLLGASSELDHAEMLQFFRIIDEQADHMRDLISDLLDVARIETGTLPVTPAAAEVAGLVDEARNTFLSGGSRNDLHIDLPPDLPLVMADRRRIVQVLINLLANASRYSTPSSTIRMTAAREGFHAAVSVTDEGRGVPAERLPHLFRKFSRIDGEDGGRDIAGSGLGLAICKGIVEAHGGRIWAESDGEGLGTRFTFTIPVVEEAATATTPLSAPPRQAEREQPRILAVAGDPRTLRHVRDTLSEAGYSPTVTADRDVALLMERSHPHLVLLDLMLPGADGMELMQDILAVADVPVIFLSGYGSDQVIARAFEMGAADFVVKPFSPTELVARIKAALRKRAALDRAEPSEPHVLGDLTINPLERSVSVAGRPVRLTATEYQVLFELSVNAGRVLTHDQLLRRVWGPANSGDARLVRAVVKRLRRKLGDDANSPTYVVTEPRVGYRMAKAEQPHTEPPASPGVDTMPHASVVNRHEGSRTPSDHGPAHTRAE